MKPLLFEIGTEELPARFITPAREALAKLIAEGLDQARIAHGTVTIYSTPRRLAALVADVAEKQQESVSLKFGPPKVRAYDAEGKPLPAAVGFAKSQGVDASELTILEKGGVEMIAVEKVEKGEDALQVLPDVLKDVISRIPFPKKMRWGEGVFEFARPIQWLVALLGSDVIPLSYAGIQAGNASRGHRFLSSGEVVIPEPGTYLERLKAAYIIADDEERLSMMREGIRRIEKQTNGRALADEALVHEILYLVEYPYPLLGHFEEDYLALPPEVLINVMKGHQRYIPLQKDDGTLLPVFITFANTVPRDPAQVARGNEKVLRARLADGRFFFDEDRKQPLDNLYERLSTVVFHVRIGSLKDKTARVEKIASHLASTLALSFNGKIERSARLIKADLLTHMVGEFPELQGTMGRIYAGYQGEDPEVAVSIAEHYLPSGTAAMLPETHLGTVMALADKLDSLVAFFSVGITPTGNLDPYALRRQTLGIIRIIVAKKLHIPLMETVEIPYSALGDLKGKLPLEKVKETLGDFVATRFRFLMMEDGHNQEFVGSILPWVPSDIYDAYMRLVALETQESIEDFKRLMVGFKRVYNITKAITDSPRVDDSLLVDQEERGLFELYESQKGPFAALMARRAYPDALAILVNFKETIDRYFDKVFVMVDDERLKTNRLGLLTKIRDLFFSFGDFSKIRVEEIARITD